MCSYDRSGLGFSDRAYQVKSILSHNKTFQSASMISHTRILVQNTSKYTDDYGESTRERDRTLPSTVERFCTHFLHPVIFSHVFTKAINACSANALVTWKIVKTDIGCYCNSSANVHVSCSLKPEHA